MNPTQQAYLLVRKLREAKPGIFYWLTFEEEAGRALAKLINLFSSYFKLSWQAFHLDLNQEDAASQFGRLLEKQSGIYILSKQLHKDLPRYLALTKQARYELASGDKISPQNLKKKLLNLKIYIYLYLFLFHLQ